jgi:hypothetical protein
MKKDSIKFSDSGTIRATAIVPVKLKQFGVVQSWLAFQEGFRV